jgi:hypothetical protein
MPSSNLVADSCFQNKEVLTVYGYVQRRAGEVFEDGEWRKDVSAGVPVLSCVIKMNGVILVKDTLAVSDSNGNVSFEFELSKNSGVLILDTNEVVHTLLKLE